MDPETTAGGVESRPMTDSMDTLFPDPDSPTRANVSLGATVRLTPLTARTVSRGNSKRTARFSISSRFGREAAALCEGPFPLTAVRPLIS
jgi:hypothetical protein